MNNQFEENNIQTIVDVFGEHGITINYLCTEQGPTITRYTFYPEEDIKISSIRRKADKIAADFSVDKVRIITPVEGIPIIWVEVPNRERAFVSFESLLPALEKSNFRLPVVLGVTNDEYHYSDNDVVIDLADAPNVLIGGDEGSGKSMLIRSIICSLLLRKSPGELKLILAQTLKTDMSCFEGCENLLRPVSYTAEEVFEALEYLAEEIENRIDLFAKVKARKIEFYNKTTEEKMPYIVCIIEETAGAVEADSKRFDTLIKRVTSVGKFCGIHLILTTDYPSAYTISAVVRSNMHTSIAMAVSNQIKSRLIIDNPGAELLLGKGDMLYLEGFEFKQPTRIQGAYVDDSWLKKHL